MSDMKQVINLLKTLSNLHIKRKIFGVEPEITIKLAKKNLNFMRFQYHTQEGPMVREKNDLRMLLEQFIVFLNIVFSTNYQYRRFHIHF